MNCVICGKEDANTEIEELGHICKNCNINLKKYSTGKAYEAKKYFDLVTESMDLDENTAMYLEIEYKKHKKEIGDLHSYSNEEENTEYSNQYNDSDTYFEIPSNNETHDDSMLEGSIRKLEKNVNTIKNILIFFAILVGFSMLGTLIYVIQLVDTIKSIY